MKKPTHLRMFSIVALGGLPVLASFCNPAPKPDPPTPPAQCVVIVHFPDRPDGYQLAGYPENPPTSTGLAEPADPRYARTFAGVQAWAKDCALVYPIPVAKITGAVNAPYFPRCDLFLRVQWNSIYIRYGVYNGAVRMADCHITSATVYNTRFFMAHSPGAALPLR